MVYPARGSHASYFSSGVHWTGDWFDFADGQRPSPPLNLHVISNTANSDGWATWPGIWGGTERPPGDVNPLDDSSPRGPGGHSQYKNPDTLLTTALVHEATLAAQPAPPPPPPAPAIAATAVGDQLTIAYDTHVDNAVGLVVAIGDRGDPDPPIVHQIPISTRTGTVVIPMSAGDHPHEVNVSVATEDRTASPVTHALVT